MVAFSMRISNHIHKGIPVYAVIDKWWSAGDLSREGYNVWHKYDTFSIYLQRFVVKSFWKSNNTVLV